MIDDFKTCNKCFRYLPKANFCTASGGKYLRSECRECEKIANKIRKELKKTVPPPPEDYSCPICKKTETQLRGTGGKKSGTWCCDHDHNTGKFRGWLCHNCNRAIGTMKDSVERLLSAVEYLEKNK